MKLSGMPTNTLNLNKRRLNPGILQDLPPIDPFRKKLLAAFSKATCIRFKSLELLNLSFMHRSVSNETNLKKSNERLEFLGDAVLGIIAATLLYERFASKPEGELAKIKSVVVSEDVLSSVALQLQIDTLLLLGKGEENSGGRTKKTILADALEALIGALYLDSGFEAAFTFVNRFLDEEINRVMEDRHHKDYKSVLQELCQQLYKNYPVYHLIKRSGPDHDRLFWVEVMVNGHHYGPGVGRNKKSAEQEAARMAWEIIKPML